MKLTRSFPRTPESVGAARRFAIEALRGTESEVLDAVELMVSELATNSIRHAKAAFELVVSKVKGQIRVEVTDPADGEPRMRSAGPDDANGRGLQIVNLLSDTWGVEHHVDTGKTVWFTVVAASSPGPRPSGRSDYVPI